MSDIVEAARGKWHGILPQFGIDARYLNKQRGPCPLCGGKDRYFWDNKEGRGTFYCNQCGAGSGIQMVAMFRNWSIKQTLQEIGKVVGEVEYKNPEPSRELTDSQKREALNKTWTGAQPLKADDPVSLYLQARTGRQWASNALRTHTELWHSDEKRSYHAMIAKVTDPDNKPVSIHRTYLLDDGSRPKISKPKMLMAGTIPDGSAIRLQPYQNILGIAEGIETAFSASAIFDIPVWAAISATIMVKWKPPENVEKIVILGDNDRNYVGQLSAYRLAHQIAREYPQRYDITVAIPNIRGADWNDFLNVHGLELAKKEAVILSPSAFRTLPVG